MNLKERKLVNTCRSSPSGEDGTSYSYCLYLLCCYFLAHAFAQTTISTGSIQGTITDPSGAVVNGAKVTNPQQGHQIRHSEP